MEPVERLRRFGTNLASAFFQFFSVTGRFHCAWLELEPSFDVADTALLALGCMAREVGLSAAPPFPFKRHDFLSGDVPEPLRGYLEALRKHAARRIVLFVNARNFPGEACPAPTAHRWTPEHCTQLKHLLQWLAEQVVVVALVWDAPFGDWNSATKVELTHGPTLERPEVLAPYVIEQVDAWDDREAARRFILGLTLFRHPCYLSALQSWALQRAPRRFSLWKDNDVARFERTTDYLRALREWRVVRDDEGQNAFMYPALQRALRDEILKTHSPVAHAEAHQGIADW